MYLQTFYLRLLCLGTFYLVFCVSVLASGLWLFGVYVLCVYFSFWFVVLVYVCVCVCTCVYIYVCLCMLGFVCFVCLFGFFRRERKVVELGVCEGSGRTYGRQKS